MLTQIQHIRAKAGMMRVRAASKAVRYADSKSAYRGKKKCENLLTNPLTKPAVLGGGFHSFQWGAGIVTKVP